MPDRASPGAPALPSALPRGGTGPRHPDRPLLPLAFTARPRRRTVRRVPAPRLVPSRQSRPSAWTLYARWEWRRATHRTF